jgi:flagellar export protein FliJ
MTNANSRFLSLLHVRRAERDRGRVELAEALHAVDAIRQQMAELSREMQRTQQMTRAASRPGALNVNRLRTTHQYEHLLELRCRQLQQREAAMESVVQTRRESLVAANQQVRMLEKILEAEMEELQLASERDTQRELDEIAQRTRLLQANSTC